MTMAEAKVSLKLLIDTSSNKVLFAEAGKDLVDIIFNLLSLPHGTVIRHLTTESMVGSLGNIYESIENLGDTYMQPNEKKESLLKPQVPPSASPQLHLLLFQDVFMATKFYTYPNSPNCNLDSEDESDEIQCVTDDKRSVCRSCTSHMTTELPFVPKAAAKVGSAWSEDEYVKGVVTYMVMDDLVVKPMSAISTITFLDNFNVKKLSALKEKVVDLTMAEGLKLLKESLQSKTVLTSVFLGNTGISATILLGLQGYFIENWS